jgi:hypothetical protein
VSVGVLLLRFVLRKRRQPATRRLREIEDRLARMEQRLRRDNGSAMPDGLRYLCPSSSRSISSRTAESHSSAMRSFGRPAARFMRIRSSIDATRTLSPSISSSVEFEFRSAKPLVPDGVPRMSSAPADVLNVKWSPARSARASSWNGTSGGAPRRCAPSARSASASRSRFASSRA